ncbi:MAG: type VI secretion system baseplate subunit TssE [Geobacteraceae bacterium]|jgi:type VI secretion system protein
MMQEQRLTERIRSQEREPMRRGGENRNRFIDSIIAHVQRILNTRQGNVLIAEDYGVPDFLDFLQSFPDSVCQIEASIRNAIYRYEPRLSGASVAFIPREDDDLTLRFQIIANLAMTEERQVFLETIVDTDGRVCVRR